MIVRHVTGMVGVLVALSLTVLPAQAQLIRESAGSTIAGTLQKTVDDADDYQFESRGDQVLVVDLDAGLFINKDTHTDSGHETGADAAAADETSHEEGGGCGGPYGWVLEVYNVSQEVICSASKPKSPGWEADPRLACFLSERGDYVLRVGFAIADGHEEPSGTPKVHPYLLIL